MILDELKASTPYSLSVTPEILFEGKSYLGGPVVTEFTTAAEGESPHGSPVVSHQRSELKNISHLHNSHSVAANSAPQDLQVLDVTANSFTIRWSRPLSRTEVPRFEIRVTRTLPSRIEIRSLLVDEKHVEMEHLQPGTEYEVGVRGCVHLYTVSCQDEATIKLTTLAVGESDEVPRTHSIVLGLSGMTASRSLLSLIGQPAQFFGSSPIRAHRASCDQHEWYQCFCELEQTSDTQRTN